MCYSISENICLSLQKLLENNYEILFINTACDHFTRSFVDLDDCTDNRQFNQIFEVQRNWPLQ